MSKSSVFKLSNKKNAKYTEKDKQRSMKKVADIIGIDSMTVDMAQGTMTIIGDVDPSLVLEKLRKDWDADIVTVGPLEEEPTPNEHPLWYYNYGYNPAPPLPLPPSYNYKPAPPPPTYPLTQAHYYDSYEDNPNACVIM